MACTNCQELPGGSTVILSEPQQPFCEQCADENSICVEKIDSACAIYHLDLTKPNKLGNLGMTNGRSVEQILEAINDLIGNNSNIPLTANSSSSINLLSTGAAGHTLTAQLTISPDVGNILESRLNGVFVGDTNLGKVKIDENDVADYLVNQLIGGSDNIVSTSIIDEDGVLQVQPSIDVQCLLDKIRLEYLEEFCQIVSLCVASLPVVSMNCAGVVISSSFEEGTPATGSASIPVSVSGSGTVTVYASGAGFYGSQTIAINPSTTSVNLTFNYDGSAPSGARSITFIISGVSGGSVSCADTVDVGCDCDMVTDITVSDISGNSADISWTGIIPAPTLGYTVVVKKSSDNSTVFTGNTLGTNITATGLAGDTQYYIEITSNCSETCESTVAGGVGTNFTTATGNNYTLSASFNGSIDSVTGTGIPSLPPTGINGTQEGVHTAMSGTYGVTISGGLIPIALKLDAYVNGIIVDCIEIASIGTYNLTISALAADDVVIAIDSGACV